MRRCCGGWEGRSPGNGYSLAVCPVIRALPEEEDRGREIVARHSDKDWSVCDAISFAIVDVRGIRGAFTFDRHFLQYGRIEVLDLSR
jgi:predicted nucleic acid-binding protein